MKLCALIKQVPDMEKVRFDRGKGVIDRKSAGVEVNPFDLHALEEAVKIKQQFEGELIVISMGPASAEKAVREGLARGADQGVLVTDPKFAGSDTWATAFILARVIEFLGDDFDLIISGVMSVDGDTAQVGPQVAEQLGIVHASFVSGLDSIDLRSIQVTTELWDAYYQVTMNLPALITVTKDINTPSLPTFKNKKKARKAEITTINLETIPALTPEMVGTGGSPTRVRDIMVPEPPVRAGKIWEANPEEAFEAIRLHLTERNL